MRSQFALASLAILALACNSPQMSHVSTPRDVPDLSLRGVAFARLSEGRVVARGTFDSVGYRRPGGRLTARKGTAVLQPEPGTGFATYGTLHVTAPEASGQVSGQRASV